ncbi:hypothetical protein PLESTF_000908100 [Pleodorina starrii]|nr:hypothetical protein PLESTF_000908100 [Pleodorina starrii]
MQTEPDRMTTEALEKLRDELAARIVALETQMKAKERGPPTRSIEELEKRFMTRFAPKNHDAFQPVHKKQKCAANGAAAAGAGPSGSSAPNPTAPTRIFSNHLNRVLSYCEWDYYKKNALCVRCGEKGHRGEDCKKFPSAKANVVERMEADQ